VADPFSVAEAGEGAGPAGDVGTWASTSIVR
jgi:hypothetical protein